MRASWFIALVGVGCGFTTSAGSGAIDATDGRVDAELDAQLQDAFSFDANPALCFGGTGRYQLCIPAAPTAPLTLTGTIDTTACVTGLVLSTGSGSPDLCVLAGTSVTASGITTVIGMRPLAVLATGNLSVPAGALIDVSSVSGPVPRRGAGANYACTGGTAASGGGGGGGGGAGGSFQSRGGKGGNGTGGNGGVSPNIVAATFVRGGCRGAAGAGTTGGSGGDSGGALYLLANGVLDLKGNVDASGAGGRGAPGTKSGGGGGGSGGMIALYGSPITLATSANIWANGGGGGGGSDSSTLGTPGGTSASPASAATGGSGDGNGGLGSLVLGNGGAGGNGSKGGGGGGGGAGVIENVTGAALTPGMFSPPSS